MSVKLNVANSWKPKKKISEMFKGVRSSGQ